MTQVVRAVLPNNYPYTNHLWPRNGHLDTLIPALFRNVKDIPYTRKAIITRDQDELDLDFYEPHQTDSLIILSHGLESSSRAKYIQGMIHYLKDGPFNFLAWNNRGCSGKLNQTKLYYHSGVSHDLEDVIKSVLEIRRYQKIYLIGFSMGGNITLKYLGEQGENLPPEIKKAIVFSTPCDLKDSSHQLKKGFNKVYTNNFLRTFKEKVKAKEHYYQTLALKKIYAARSIPEFDELFTAPVNSFASAEDYYNKASSIHFLSGVKASTTIINSANDPFLGPKCYPYEQVKENPSLNLFVPKGGGHCGFFQTGNSYWSEQVASLILEA